MSDFFPARSDPRSARLGGSLWLASGRDCNDRNRCVIKIMLCRCTPTYFLLFFRSYGRLAKVNMLFRLMISDIGTDESSSLSLTPSGVKCLTNFTYFRMWCHNGLFHDILSIECYQLQTCCNERVAKLPYYIHER